MTIEEFKEKNFPNYHWDVHSAELLAVEFAKYHVEQALSTASKKALIEYGMDEDENPFLGNPVWSEDYKYRGDRLPTMKIYKPSILESYPLENIK